MKLQPCYLYLDDGETRTDTVVGYRHWCPACKEPHSIAVLSPTGVGSVWTFDGNLERPTFTPSIRLFITDMRGGRTTRTTLCHYFIHDGSIIYCGDCPHPMRGKTVPLPDYPDMI